MKIREKYLYACYPSTVGIFAGINKGKVWYDNEENPTLAVAYSYCVGGCGVIGEILEVREEEAKEFFEKVFDSLRQQNVNELEFSSENEALYGIMWNLI